MFQGFHLPSPGSWKMWFKCLPRIYADAFPSRPSASDLKMTRLSVQFVTYLGQLMGSQVTYLGWAWKQGPRSPSTRPSAVPQQRWSMAWRRDRAKTGRVNAASKIQFGDIENKWCVWIRRLCTAENDQGCGSFATSPWSHTQFLWICQPSRMCTYHALLFTNGPLQILCKPLLFAACLAGMLASERGLKVSNKTRPTKNFEARLHLDMCDAGVCFLKSPRILFLSSYEFLTWRNLTQLPGLTHVLWQILWCPLVQQICQRGPFCIMPWGRGYPEEFCISDCNGMFVWPSNELECGIHMNLCVYIYICIWSPPPRTPQNTFDTRTSTIPKHTWHSLQLVTLDTVFN